MDDFMEVGMSDRLQSARAAKGLTPEEVASEWPLSAQAIRDYERGTRPGAEAIRALCFAYGVTADWLLGIPPVRQR